MMKQRTIIIIVLFALVAAGVGIGWYRTVRPGAVRSSFELASGLGTGEASMSGVISKL